MWFLLEEKYPKLAEIEFFIDFAGRYARRGWLFFDILECVCSFGGMIVASALALFFAIERRRIVIESDSASPFYLILIGINFLVIILILIHLVKERPRWRLAQYYREISRYDIYAIKKDYIYIKYQEDIEALNNKVQKFKEKFSIKDSALLIRVYNECLIARGIHPVLPNVTFIDRIFPSVSAFLL